MLERAPRARPLHRHRAHASWAAATRSRSPAARRPDPPPAPEGRRRRRARRGCARARSTWTRRGRSGSSASSATASCRCRSSSALSEIRALDVCAVIEQDRVAVTVDDMPVVRAADERNRSQSRGLAALTEAVAARSRRPRAGRRSTCIPTSCGRRCGMCATTRATSAVSPGTCRPGSPASVCVRRSSRASAMTGTVSSCGRSSRPKASTAGSWRSTPTGAHRRRSARSGRPTTSRSPSTAVRRRPTGSSSRATSTRRKSRRRRFSSRPGTGLAQSPSRETDARGAARAQRRHDVFDLDWRPSLWDEPGAYLELARRRLRLPTSWSETARRSPPPGGSTRCSSSLPPSSSSAAATVRCCTTTARSSTSRACRSTSSNGLGRRRCVRRCARLRDRPRDRSARRRRAGQPRRRVRRPARAMLRGDAAARRPPGSGCFMSGVGSTEPPRSAGAGLAGAGAGTSLLLRSGEWDEVTPESAGWEHLSFRAVRRRRAGLLRPG